MDNENIDGEEGDIVNIPIGDAVNTTSYSMSDGDEASGTPTRYIVGIYHVYTMHIPRGSIYLVYTRYIH